MKWSHRCVPQGVTPLLEMGAWPAFANPEQRFLHCILPSPPSSSAHMATSSALPTEVHAKCILSWGSIVLLLTWGDGIFTRLAFSG